VELTQDGADLWVRHLEGVPARRQRLDRRPHVNHRRAATLARRTPGRWILAGVYERQSSAQRSVREVRSARRLLSYQPPGSFEARAAATRDKAVLWVRYLGEAGR
jgi:hypothetical protein